jgi:hypothetical protein
MTPEELRLTIVVKPTAFPVTMDEARAHMRIDSDDAAEDAIISANINAATAYAEKWLGLALITRTFDLFLDQWPTRRTEKWWDGTRTGSISEMFQTERELMVPFPPLQSVTHIKTYDDSDTESTFAASKYFVDTATKPGRIVLRDAAETPAPTRVANGLEIRCVAGYGDDYADVPENIRQGILRMAAHLFEARGECPLEEAADVSGAGALWGIDRAMRL